jgi:tetratricopeptide (TPR) repeat protein
VAIDREATLRKAEKLLRQGRLEQAIAEYNRVIKEQPQDWSTINAVGDLLVRAGQPEGGIAHFTRIADHFFAEGFFSRAAAVYKKILKLAPDNDHAALCTAEIAEQQGLVADAKVALSHVAARRLRRGDKTGAAEIHLKLGLLDPADLKSGVSAALAAAELGNVSGAVERLLQIASEHWRRQESEEALQALGEAARLQPGNLDVRAELAARLLATGALERAVEFASSATEFKAIASEYYARGKSDDALQVLQWALDQDPSDIETRRQLVRSHVGRADLEGARALLAGDVTDPELLLSLAEIEVRTGHYQAGREAAVRLIAAAPGRRDELMHVGLRVCAADAEAGFQCVDVATDAAVAEHEFAAAAAGLGEYVAIVPGHVPALMKLVEVCVDGGLGAAMYKAQAQLADAYLENGLATEARVIAEDLFAHEPWEPTNIERFRKALSLLGEPDPEAVIADRLSGDSLFISTDLTLDFSFNELARPLDAADVPEVAKAPATGEMPGIAVVEDARPAGVEPGPSPVVLAAAPDQHAPGSGVDDADAIEIDLGETSGSWGTGDAGAATASGQVPPGLAGLERVFEGFREEAVRHGAHDSASHYQKALDLEEAGETDRAIHYFERAARSARHRFRAAGELARIHRRLGHAREAIEWLERAAESSPAGTAESQELLYDLGLLLAEAGETERALAVLIELHADVPDYRDVAQQIARLSQKA